MSHPQERHETWRRKYTRRPPAAPQVEQLYTPAEAQALLRVGKTRLFSLIQSGELSPTYSLGRRQRRIPASAITRYLEGRKV